MAKVDDGLIRRLQAMSGDRSAQEVPVLVTLRAGVDTTELRRAGLNVVRTIQSVSAVAGTVAADKVEDLAALDQVEAIDYDGEIRASE